MNEQEDRNNQFDENDDAYENPLNTEQAKSDSFPDIFTFDDLVNFLDAVHTDLLEEEQQKQGPLQF